MSSPPFTPEQEARLREIIREEGARVSAKLADIFGETERKVRAVICATGRDSRVRPGPGLTLEEFRAQQAAGGVEGIVPLCAAENLELVTFTPLQAGYPTKSKGVRRPSPSSSQQERT